ncbi:glycosyltransferase family 2 protein [Rubrivirga marina]|uniref:Glycosyl hydrolase n=1 Tax=Rubrivirga marina TaxID=1196024 RepID=A0A271IZQ0_9BACT|nr:glycosyltransferase family 2 protein [Rubrivirga marina]PAP76610.1 glycosyl hydrolase [Rubrivirga marina]
MSVPRVSVVIVTWNGRLLLERFLPSVLATDYPDLEVVVADNASEDGTAEWLAEAHPEVVMARHAENLLFAGGNNAAVPYATGDLVCFLNNDVEVPPGWLTPLVAALDDPGVVAVQPKLLQHGDRTQFEYAGASGGVLDAFGYPFTRGRLFDTLEPDTGQYDDACDVFWATGAALLVRRDAFETAGGFDEAFGMHMEEIDLCWRMQRAGGRIRVEPASEVYHLGGASLPQGDPRKMFFNVRNSLVMLAKNLPPREARRALRGRRVLDAVAAARSWIGGDRAEADAIRRAVREARERIRSVDGPPEAERPVLPPYRGSVVLDYFLRGRRRFSDLPASAFRPGWRPTPPAT